LVRWFPFSLFSYIYTSNFWSGSADGHEDNFTFFPYSRCPSAAVAVLLCTAALNLIYFKCYANRIWK
jgi:hypothetical protein